MLVGCELLMVSLNEFIESSSLLVLGECQELALNWVECYKRVVLALVVFI